MKKHTRNEDGHIIYNNAGIVDIVKQRKASQQKAKEDSANIVVLNRQVRRALDQINTLTERVKELEAPAKKATKKVTK